MLAKDNDSHFGLDVLSFACKVLKTISNYISMPVARVGTCLHFGDQKMRDESAGNEDTGTVGTELSNLLQFNMQKQSLASSCCSKLTINRFSWEKS